MTTKIDNQRDAMVAEIFGEVFKLQEQVKLLGESLPKIVARIESSASENIGHLVRAGNYLKSDGDKFSETHTNKILQDLEKSRYKSLEDYEQRIRMASEEARKKMVSAAKDAIFDSVSRPMIDFTNKINIYALVIFGSAILCGVMGAATYSWAKFHFEYTKEEKVQMVFGGKLSKVWDKLDKKTQALIQAAE